MTRNAAALFASIALVLSLCAWQAPALGAASDRGAYEATAERFLVPDCSDLHCFRVLVPWLLGPWPGSSIVKWKSYAVVANLAAGVAVYALSLALGLSSRAASMAGVMSGMGFGSLYTMYDPFTSDPLMYAIGPFLTLLAIRDRLTAAGLVAAVSVLAKEFAAAPMLMSAAASAIGRRWSEALRVLVAANWALIVWLVLQLTLIIGFNYSYDGNASTHLLSGGYFGYWWSHQHWTVSLFAIAGELGVLWILAPAALLMAPPRLRWLTLAAIPVAMIFGYVQQPDRALWNFHFLATPLAAIVLDRSASVLAWSVVVLFAAANMRLGAQLPFVPPSRLSLAASLILGVMCVWSATRPRNLAIPA